MGTLIEVDGSTFYGFWAGGKMHGEGVRVFSCPVGYFWFAISCVLAASTCTASNKIVSNGSDHAD